MRYFLMTLITLFGVSIISTAYAGQCIKQRADSEIIENSDIIFEGKLSTMSSTYQDVPRKKEDNILKSMTVLKLWKGGDVKIGDDVIISQNYYHAVGIYAGKNYIVFGRGGRMVRIS